MASSSRTIPTDWDSAREVLSISAEKAEELRNQSVEVRDLFFMSSEDLREYQLSTVTRSRVAQLRQFVETETSANSQSSKEKEFSIGLAGVKGFTGEPEGYESFLFQLESFIKDPGVRCRVCVARLESHALKWYITVGKTFDESEAGWLALKRDMDLIFSDPNLKTRATEQLRSKKWEPTEKAQEYALSTLELCRRAKILTEAEQLEQLRLGLDSEAKRFIVLSKPSTVAQFIQALTEYENTGITIKKEVLAVDFKQQQVCARCGRKGHLKAKCWSKTNINGDAIDNSTSKQRPKGGLKCFRCSEDHRVQECPWKVVKEGEEIKLVRSYLPKTEPISVGKVEKMETDQQGSRTPEVICSHTNVCAPREIATVISNYFSGRITVNVGGTNVTALIDSGASLSIIHDSLLSQIKKTRTRDSDVDLRTADNSSFRTSGIITTHLKIGILEKEIELVTTPCNMPERVILGRDAQTLFDFKITTKGVEINRQLSKWQQQGTVKSRHTYKIPAKSTQPIAVNIQDNWNSKEILLIKEDNSRLQERGVHLITGIASSKGPGQRRHILVVNESEEDCFIKKGEIIGSTRNAEICNLAELSDGQAAELIEKMKAKGHLELEDSGKSYSKVKINPDVKLDQQKALLNLVEEFRDIFAEVLSQPADLPEMPINLKTDKPVVWRPSARVPFKWRSFIDDMINQGLRQGVIKPSTSEFSAPIVVTMTAGKLRMCIDYRGLNMNTIVVHPVIPRIDEIFMKLKGSQFISTSDCTLGYNQMRINPEDTHKTAFSCHRGQFEYLFAPLGLVNVPRYYNEGMKKAFAELLFVQTYFDDISCYSKTFEEHLLHLRRLFTICREKKITLKGSKTNLGFQSIDYLGHEVSGEYVRPRKEKADAIANFPKPTSLKAAVEFISMANYYRNFVPRFSHIADDFQKMINTSKQKKTLLWTDAAEKAFDTIRKTIAERICLGIPDPQKPFSVTIDSSEKGWGLEMKQDDQVVAFTSGSFNETERRYSPCERECLGIILGLEKMKDFLKGGKFDLFTDCRAIKWLRESKNDSSKLFRWAARLSEFDMEIHHVSGSSIPHVDAASRNPIPFRLEDPTSPSTIAALSEVYQTRTSFKKRIKKILGYEKVRFPEDHKVKETISIALSDLKQNKESLMILQFDSTKEWFETILQRKISFIGQPVIIKEIDPSLERKYAVVHFTKEGKVDNILQCPPATKIAETHRPACWKELLEAAHDHPWSGHAGRRKTLKRLEMFKKDWTSMTQDVEEYLKTCKLCQQSKVDRTRRTAHGTFQQINLPFSRIGADIVGPLHVTKEGYRYILFLICHASRWTEAIPLRVADTTNVLKAFHDNWITRYGIPDEVISDNSSVFDGKAATSFWNDRKIQKIKVSAYHQSSNGLCERNISELVDTLKLNSGELTDTWADQLPTALASLRNKMSNATGLSPY
jgi:hypothetical protein